MSVWNALKIVGQALTALEITEGVIEMTDSEESRKEELHDDTTAQEDSARSTFVEEIEVEASQLVERIKELIREGNARTLRVKDSKGKYLLEIPLTVGVMAGGIFALAAPTAAFLGSIVGFVAKVKIEIVREIESDDAEMTKPDAIQISAGDNGDDEGNDEA